MLRNPSHNMKGGVAMTLDELLDTCRHSSEDDWNLMHCWGGRSGPSYLDQFLWSGSLDDNLEHYAHGMRASYKPNLAIGIAWGLEIQPGRNRYEADWATNFPDSEASGHFLDFFYQGMFINREVWVSVDGGRCMLPAPRRILDDAEGPAPKTVGFSISGWQYDFFRTVDALEKHSDFDTYVKQAGFEVVD